MSNQPTFTIVNQAADGDYCLAIRGGKLVLALSDPSDPYQQWMRKDSATTDKEGQRAFALVNKANNEAVKHEGTTGPMTLVPYTAGSLQDNSLLWSESKNYEGQDFRYIRRASAISHHITANAHEIQDGRIVDLSGGNHISERWKFVPYNDQQVTTLNTVTISCRRKDGYNLTIRDDTLVLAPADNKDRYQIWIREPPYGYQVKDQENKRAFALINKATGKAIKHGFGTGYLAQLAPFNRNNLDGSFLWTMIDKGQGFQEIRMQSNTSTVFHAFYVHEPDSNKALLALRPRNNSNDQQWMFQETTVWDSAWDTSTTSPAPKPSGPGQWDPDNADFYFDSSNSQLQRSIQDGNSYSFPVNREAGFQKFGIFTTEGREWEIHVKSNGQGTLDVSLYLRNGTAVIKKVELSTIPNYVDSEFVYPAYTTIQERTPFEIDSVQIEMSPKDVPVTMKLVLSVA